MKPEEQIFCDKIDCNFPYNDRKKTTQLIYEANNISPNAIFQIIDEVARIPANERKNTNENRLHEILNEIENSFHHPIKEKMLQVARTMVNQNHIEEDKSLKLMDEVSKFPGLWGALMTLNESNIDSNGTIDSKYDEIRELWNNQIANKVKFIIITGPPYSGKGTQCDELVKEYGLIHLSTGEHIRKEKDEKTALGKTMSDYDERGELVPDEIMKQLLDKLLEENKEASGIILDGYPRTIPQVHDLVNVLDSRNIPINNIINIEVPTDELLKRAKKRAETSTREDDKNPDTHYKRIRVFEEQTKPTIEFMKNKFTVNTFDGLGTIEEITERIKASM